MNFKLFGSLAITVVFIAGQAIYLSRHINGNNDSKDAS
ncbi:MAG TPA: septation protein A, partial [Methylophaga sp.]|nr:septation protein A [Methylophaga sp.]